MTRPFPMQKREVLVALRNLGEGLFFAETQTVDRTYTTAAEALLENDGQFDIKFFLFNVDDGSPTDVTEEMATAYLQDTNLTPDDEDRLPVFVRTSEAWELFCEEWTTRNGLFSQRSHGTLNHAMQGLGR